MTASGVDAHTRVRVLHLEDDESDAELVRAALDDGGLAAEVVRVATREEYVAALQHGGFDLVLSDFALPSFDGASALEIARAEHPALPFIFVSGTMGEDAAVLALQRGAWDYVLKDRLTRLPSAVLRSIEEAAERRRRTEAEERLLESEERFRLFMDASPLAALVKDAEGRIVYANRTAARFLDRPSSELLGRTAFDLFPPPVAREINATDLRGLAGESLNALEVLPGPDGRPCQWDVYKFPMRDAQRRRLVGAIAVDVTERLQLEEKYLHAQKMEAVGRLAGGVAHDFNNLLTVIGGYADLVSGSLEDPELISQVEEIRQAALAASGLTRQLLAFARREVVQPTVLELGDVIGKMGNMLRRIIGEDVRLEIVQASRDGYVRADRGQIEQVVMNLVVNARDATASGGMISIRTADAPWQVLEGADPDLTPGPYVAFSVSDTGVGIPPEVLPRLFEPFFTTKEQGKGTGLGLATVQGIVKQCGGHIRVATALGRGTTFEVFLPRVNERPRPGRATTVSGGRPRGNERVLVVEDDRGVCTLIRRVLEDSGYDLLVAHDGVEAAAALERFEGQLDLLITDLVMPGMNGSDLVLAARTARPELRVLLLSGYADRVTVRSVADPRTTFLRKPFSSGELLRKVREALDWNGS